MHWTVNASILLTELPLTERPAAAARHGFRRTEFWWPFPTATPAPAEIDGFVRSLRDAGVQLTGLNLFAGDMPAGERGILSHPDRTAEFRAGVESLVQVARATGCRGFNALYGARLPGPTAREQDNAAVANLRFAADAVAPFGGVVLVEPLSGVPGYPLRTAADVMAVTGRVDRENVKLLADFYHLAVNGEDVDALIERHAADFGHIQIADAPGRHEPGTGELPLHRWVARARELGYAGPVALEYAPSQDDPFAWLPRGQRGWTRSAAAPRPGSGQGGGVLE